MRKNWIDIAKGLGIISVVYGHCIQSLCNELFLYIYTFHMPLFYFLSGLCFKTEKYADALNQKDFFCKRITQLVIPLLGSCLLFGALTKVLNIGHYTIEQLAYGSFPSAMWFVFSLLMVQGVYYFFLRCFHSKYLDWIIVLFSIVLACYVSVTGFCPKFYLNTVPLGLLFFTWGVMMQKPLALYGERYIKTFSHKFFTGILLLTPFVYILHYKEPLSVATGHIPAPVFGTLIIAGVGILAIVSISLILESSNLVKTKDVLIYLGRNSLIVLMFHLFYICVSAEYIKPIIGIGTEPLTVWIWLFLTIPLVNRYLPFLAGKGFVFKRSSL